MEYFVGRILYQEGPDMDPLREKLSILAKLNLSTTTVTCGR